MVLLFTAEKKLGETHSHPLYTRQEMRNHSHSSPGQAESWTMERVCAQTTALGVPHEWISHSAWLPAPQKDGCWLSHLGFHVLKSTGSPLTGTNQNFFAPKKCVISFLTKE